MKEIPTYTELFDAAIITLRCNLCEEEMHFSTFGVTNEGIEEAKREHNATCELIVRETK